jgi:hypothetical protein
MQYSLLGLLRGVSNFGMAAGETATEEMWPSGDSPKRFA